MRKPSLAITAGAAISLTLASCSAGAQVEPAAQETSTSYSADTTNPPTASEHLASLYEPGVVDTSDGDAQDWDGNTIATGGTYRITGEVGDITVEAPEETVVLVLDNAKVSGRVSIDADAAALVLNGNSTIAATGLGTDEGAIHATSDLTVTGSGVLAVESDGDGIVAKDDLVIAGGSLTVNAGDDAIRGTDSVSVRDGAVLDLTAGGDGIAATKDDDDTKGWIHIAGGDVDINATDDSLSAFNDVIVTGGNLNLTAADKGINAGRYILHSSGQVRVDAADDAVHSDGALRLSGGDIEVTAQDDGVHAEVAAVLDGAKLTVLNSEEALEAGLITISDGEIALTATDDGINASGSTTVEDGLAAKESDDADALTDDGEGSAAPNPAGMPQPPSGVEGMPQPPSGMEGMPQPPSGMVGMPEPPSDGGEARGMGGGAMGENTGEQLTVTGGTVVVNAGGDGLDSNGDATISGGTVTIFGPTNNGNGALDTNGALTVTGGELWAVGSSGMAEAPSTDGQAWVQASVDLRAGDNVTVSDGEGNAIATLTVEKEAQNIVYSSPSIDAEGTYKVNGAEVSANTATQGNAGGPGGMGREQGGVGFGGVPNGAPGVPPAQRDTQAAVLPQDRRERA